MTIFPNPTQVNFSIYLSREVNNAHLEIMNMIGEIFYSTMFSGQQLIIKQGFSPGIYFVKVTDGGKQTIDKLIVQ